MYQSVSEFNSGISHPLDVALLLYEICVASLKHEMALPFTVCICLQERAQQVGERVIAERRCCASMQPRRDCCCRWRI
jgi:hypothetical protein